MAVVGVLVSLAILSLWLLFRSDTTKVFLRSWRLFCFSTTNDKAFEHKIPRPADTTPKARLQESAPAPSIFVQGSPNGHLNPSSTHSVMAESTPSTPQQTSSDTARNLMPPPLSRPTPRANPTPQTQPSLRVPSTGPLPNRNPPQQHQQSKALGATASTLAPSARPRKQVVLSPGHSPLDWAQKTRTTPTQQLSGVPFPQRITPSQLAWATGRKGKPAWSAYKGRVYNITPYLKFHPGGEAELMRAAGRDAQPLFEEVHAWVNWENMLGACLVGFLVSEAEGASRDSSSA